MRLRFCLTCVFYFALITVVSTNFAVAQQSNRAAWTTSKITGSPEPPSPFKTERVYPQLKFDQPVCMVSTPGTNQTILVERKGRIFQLPANVNADTTHLVLDGASSIQGLTAIYGVAFHPNFAKNRTLFVCYIQKPELPAGTRVSRFQVSQTNPLTIDAKTEEVLLTWKSGGHNGGCLKFGPDGFLYISTGDGSPPAPADVHRTGQDISDFLASILRIDVDQKDSGKAYGIPTDNPFVKTPGAKGEVWAYGFRNPWRMNFDRKTGELWVGDVGWQLWEMVYKVTRGANFGWSIKEGLQVVHPEWKRGPTPVEPPIIALPRSEAASVTGGFVYRGQRLKQLTGAYVYGDYVSGKLWALRHDGTKLKSQVELADTNHAIIAFHEDDAGELTFMDYNSGTIHRLAPNESAAADNTKFPRLLSQTGLFESTKNHKPASGVYPFDVNVPQWMDHATAERFVAVPGKGKIVLHKPQGRVPTDWGEFPKDSVLVKTISLETERGNPNSRRRIETQVLHNRGVEWRGNSGEWFGYTYIWNADQTDAELAPINGKTLELTVTDQRSDDKQQTIRWPISGRSQCYACHNPWAGYRLGFTYPQLKQGQRKQQAVEQLSDFKHLGLLDVSEVADQDRFANPYDILEVLNTRARSYLHVNCAHCHRFGGGGTASIDLKFQVPLDEMKLLNLRPTQGAFGMRSAQLVRPGYPGRSVLTLRMAKLGAGRMPHIGSSQVDIQGLELIYDWIRSLPKQGGPNEAAAEEKHYLEQMKLIGDFRARRNNTDQTVTRLLSSPSSALSLLDYFLLAEVPGERFGNRMDKNATGMRKLVAQQAKDSQQPVIRDMFERYLPHDQRVRRMGNSVNVDQLLALAGDRQAGRRLFFESKTMRCKNCHKVGELGGNFGPNLTKLSKQRSREQILESIIAPSKKIDPKFQLMLLETKKGRVHNGLIEKRTNEQITLRTAHDKRVTIKATNIELLVPQQKSIMPDLLYRDLTAQQLADLLAFLSSAQ